MPRRKKEPWDTPEIQALGAGFAGQGYHNSGYEKARIFANAATSQSLAARDLASELKFKDTRELRSVFDRSFKNPVRNVHGRDPATSVQGTQLAMLKGMPVFKFKDVAAANASPKLKRAFNDWLRKIIKNTSTTVTWGRICCGVE